MSMIKIGFVILTGALFGFGVDRINDSEAFRDSSYGYYMHDGYCAEEGEFLGHMLENLTTEERILVENKVEELLATYNTTLEDLYQDSELRHDFMSDLMDFLDDNNIDIHDHDDWHHGPGMH